MLGYKKETGTPPIAGESMTMVGQEFQDKTIALFWVHYTQDILMKQWENVRVMMKKSYEGLIIIWPIFFLKAL